MPATTSGQEPVVEPGAGSRVEPCLFQPRALPVHGDYRSRYRLEYNKVPFGHWRQRYSESPPTSGRKDPPYLYKTPRSGVYAYPGTQEEIYFYKDRWYSRFKGVWYWSWSYNGPWAYTDVDRVPGKMRDMPRQKYEKDDDRFKKVPWKRQDHGRGGKWKGEDNDY
ncbi:MAG: hypothetical protein P1S46_06680 [bacterium]|nr:hypothetical protein [bacterium]